MNTVPLMGSSLMVDSSLFQTIVKNKSKVILALDEDVEKKACTIGKKFLQYGVETYKIEVSPYGDVGNMPKGEFLLRYENADRVNESYLLRNRMRSL